MKHSGKLISKSRYMLSATVLIMLISVSVSAYTIVMRGGRRIQIPEQFTVGASTITYIAGPEIQITLQMAAIDIAATERANGELPGSFLNRRTAPLQPLQLTSPPNPKPKAARTITNRDLERHARVRIESEAAYEVRRRELGLLSVAESRIRREAEESLLLQDLADARMEETDNEGYWRSRASELRSELVAVDAELGVVRTRLDEIATNLNNPFTVVSSVYPNGYLGRGFRYGGQRRSRYGRNMQPLLGLGFPTDVYSTHSSTVSTFGGTTHRQTYQSGTTLNGRNGLAVVMPQLFPFQNLTSFSSPYNYDLSYEREALVLRLNELVGRRAGLRARWRDLEEEARRAGAMPGWLRP